jgi:hypothetical protein
VNILKHLRACPARRPACGAATNNFLFLQEQLKGIIIKRPAVLHTITVIDHEHQERHGTGRKHARFESESPKVTFFFLHPQGSGKGGMSSLLGFLSSSDVFKKEYDMDPKGEALANFDQSRLPRCPVLSC